MTLPNESDARAPRERWRVERTSRRTLIQVKSWGQSTEESAWIELILFGDEGEHRVLLGREHARGLAAELLRAVDQ